MTLTITQTCRRLNLSRSTVIRALRDGTLAGRKVHSCGSPCAEPSTCQQGCRWEIDEQAVAAFLVPEAS